MYKKLTLKNLIASSLFLLFFLLSSTAFTYPALYLPWTCDESYYVITGHNELSHTGNGAWAWDFSMPEGTLLRAPADGTVRMVYDNSTQWGCDSSYAWDANYLVIDFGDGTEALYAHLEAGSALVYEGQSVQAGDPVARVGLSGYTCGSHVHFQIQEPCTSWACQSIPASFYFAGDPERGDLVTSQNSCGTSDEPAPEPDPVYAVSISPSSQSAPGAPGEVVVYDYMVCNDGDTADTYSLSTTSTWDATVTTTSINSLSAGSCASVTVEHVVPTDASDGATDAGQLAVNSTNASISDSATFETIADVVTTDPEPTPDPEPTEPLDISSISPSSASTSSSVQVTVTGAGIQPGASLTLEDGKGPSPQVFDVAVQDSSTLTAALRIKKGGPPRARSWTVRVTNPDGSTALLLDGFTVTP